MRICAIDIGTNTVQSLVADVRDGALTVVSDTEQFARLGQGVDAARRLAPEAMDRVVDRLARAQRIAEDLGAERTVLAATSASRDAANVADLQARVRRELGLDYAVIPGEEEAALSFTGALSVLPHMDAAAVVDIGGGSTEIATGTRSTGITARTSLNMGSVRLTERHVRTRPPSATAGTAAREEIQLAFEHAAPDLLRALEPVARGVLPLVATGSVARLVARLAGAGDLATPVPADAVTALRDRLLGATIEETLAIDPGVMAGREDVAAMAVVILDTVLRLTNAAHYLPTTGGLRHGLALRAASV
jgi:exopolyphosphatase/guanosine-5'-triphosphate,3'-diphosphate pyrophosphatase